MFFALRRFEITTRKPAIIDADYETRLRITERSTTVKLESR